MDTTTIALILAALASAFAAAAIFVALLAFRRAPLAGNGPLFAPGAAPAGITFHDAALLLSMLGMLIHGNTEDRNPILISSRAKSIADQMVQVRRAA